MLESLRIALAQAIKARLEGRLDMRKGQKMVAEEFGLTQADVSLVALGQWDRMSLDKMMRIAQAFRIGLSGPVQFVADADSGAEFSASLGRIKNATATEFERRADARLKNVGEYKRQAKEKRLQEAELKRKAAEYE